jgi:hypothetical protein
MLVLLAISTLAAALVPAPGERDPAPGERARQPQSRPSPEPRRAGAVLTEARIDAAASRPALARIERGDQLALEVSAPFGDQIEVAGLGLVETVDRFAPAAFDILAPRRGTFAVRALDANRVVARIVVGAPGSGRCGVLIPEARPGPARAPACDRRGKRASAAGGRSARQP